MFSWLVADHVVTGSVLYLMCSELLICTHLGNPASANWDIGVNSLFFQECSCTSFPPAFIVSSPVVYLSACRFICFAEPKPEVAPPQPVTAQPTKIGRFLLTLTKPLPLRITYMYLFPSKRLVMLEKAIAIVWCTQLVLLTMPSLQC